jgi:hypothetical protein
MIASLLRQKKIGDPMNSFSHRLGQTIVIVGLAAVPYETLGQGVTVENRIYILNADAR